MWKARKKIVFQGLPRVLSGTLEVSVSPVQSCKMVVRSKRQLRQLRQVTTFFVSPEMIAANADSRPTTSGIFRSLPADSHFTLIMIHSHCVLSATAATYDQKAPSILVFWKAK